MVYLLANPFLGGGNIRTHLRTWSSWLLSSSSITAPLESCSLKKVVRFFLTVEQVFSLLSVRISDILKLLTTTAERFKDRELDLFPNGTRQWKQFHLFGKAHSQIYYNMIYYDVHDYATSNHISYLFTTGSTCPCAQRRSEGRVDRTEKVQTLWFGAMLFWSHHVGELAQHRAIWFSLNYLLMQYFLSITI